MRALTIFACGLLALTAACSKGADSGRNQGNNPIDNGGVLDGGGPSGMISGSGGSVRAAYQVKTSTEIASALATCFGPNVTTVDVTMIQTAENPAGFLASRKFSAGDDVLVGEASILDGDPSVARVGVRNANISLPVLSALQDIGNVVGQTCAANVASNALCDCTTPANAHAMLGRCLPAIAPSAYANLEATFATACTKDLAAAIASLVASTAFGVR
jgi:hypothetical protein